MTFAQCEQWRVLNRRLPVMVRLGVFLSNPLNPVMPGSDPPRSAAADCPLFEMVE